MSYQLNDEDILVISTALDFLLELPANSDWPRHKRRDFRRRVLETKRLVSGVTTGENAGISSGHLRLMYVALENLRDLPRDPAVSSDDMRSESNILRTIDRNMAFIREFFDAHGEDVFAHGE